MKNFGKAVFGFAVIGILVIGAYFANEAKAGGGNNPPPFVPFNFFQQQAPVQPSLFDLQREEAATF